MKLEFLKDVNEYGDEVIRLYDFPKEEAAMLRDVIRAIIVEGGQPIDLAHIPFIELVNCRLILHISEENEGIHTQDRKLFFCDLTLDGYKNMLQLMEPYCQKDLRSFRMLYDLDTEIDFLFSPYGESAIV
ncbi:MAG: hypothetical protein M3R27_05760 [Bacteroidota bacterium]|nr:hypothetical protein [Bacteroidota bacterium]